MTFATVNTFTPCHRDEQKTSRPVRFEITQPTRDAVSDWIKTAKLGQDDCLFPSRIHESFHIGTRQYARIVDSWVSEIGLNPSEYGTHAMRRTKASLIYRRTKNLRAVQLLLGHTKLESTVRYLWRKLTVGPRPDSGFRNFRTGRSKPVTELCNLNVGYVATISTIAAIPPDP